MKAKYIFLAASALLLGSCSDIEEFVGGSGSQNEITFGDSFVGKAHTRAATGDLSSETLKNFPVKVWGEKYSGTAYNKNNATTVFDGTKLTYSADGDVWAYEGDDKKWEDFNYDFVGFAPFESTATATYTDGKATVSGVPLVQEIKNESGALSGEDYLLSKVTTSKNGSKREAVSLTFDHILSRLTLKAYTSLSDQYKVTLNSLQLFTPTMSETGSATYTEAAHEGPDKDQDTWTWTGFNNIDNATSAETLKAEGATYAEQEMVNAAITPADASASTGIELAKGESAAKQLSKEFFVAPTKGQTVTFYVKATYTVAFANGSDSKQYTKFVKVDALKEGLVQGYQHNLFIDINPKAIAFHVYAVEGWQLDNFSNDFINEKGKSFGFNLEYDQTNSAITGILHAKANYLTNGNDKYLQYSVASIAKEGETDKVSTTGNTMTIDGWYSSVANAQNQVADDKQAEASVSHAYAHFTIEPDYDFLGTAGVGDYVISIKNNMNDVNTAKINIPIVKEHWFTMTATPEQFHVKVVAKCGGNVAQSFAAANANFGLVGATAGKVATVSDIKWYDNAEGNGTSTTAWSKTNRYAHFTVTPDAGNFTKSGGNYTLKLVNNFSEAQSQNVTFSFAEMKFTIKTTAAKQSFSVPLATGTTPARMAIVWGENEASTNDVSSISTSNRTHTYASAGTYQVRILSLETDATKKQIPEFNFSQYPDLTGKDKTTVSGSYNYNYNGEKLISMDSPVLNSGETNLYGMFYGTANLTSVDGDLLKNYPNATNARNMFFCSSSKNVNKALKNIPATLFKYNTKLTSVQQAFGNCTALQSIPSGMFDTNVNINDFKNLFFNCSSLETVPSGLFAKNSKATTFASTFQGCYNLKMVADVFIDESAGINKNNRFTSVNTWIDFSSTFSETGKSRKSGSYGEAVDLWYYKFNSSGWGYSGSHVTYLYAEGSSSRPTWFTNYKAIPDKLFSPNASVSSDLKNSNFIKK